MINNKGFSLLTTLVLSAAAIIFISALVYFIRSEIKATSGVELYKSSLEVAKGASEMLMKGVDEYKVECDFDKDKVRSFLDSFAENTSSYTIKVDKFLCEKFYTENGSGEAYFFELSVLRNHTDEKAVVSFGYAKNTE